MKMRDCKKEYLATRDKTDIDKKCYALYCSMRDRQHKKFSKELPFTFVMFKEWCYKNGWEKLFIGYKENNFSKWFAPSVDRINHKKAYSFDNMQLLTFKENSIKGLYEIPRTQKMNKVFVQNWKKLSESEKENRMKMLHNDKQKAFIKKIKRPIFVYKNYELIAHFPSAWECCLALPFLQNTNVVRCLKGKVKTHKGLQFRYERGDLPSLS